MQPLRHPLLRRGAIAAGVVLIGLCVLAVVGPLRPSREADSNQLLTAARAASARGDYGRAESLASRVEAGTSQWARAQLVAGEAAYRAGRPEDALAHYGRVPRDGSPPSVLPAYSFGEVCREIGRLSEAEAAYRYVLEHEPRNAAAHMRMAFVLGVTGRRWESRPHFMFLVRSGKWTLDSLVLLGDLERPMEQEDFLQRCAAGAPDDVLVQLGLAAHAMAAGRSSEAREGLQRIVALRPELIAGQAMLGELLANTDDTRFVNWHKQLPAAADNHPDVWFVRGLWARRHRELHVAARCFWETVRRAPAHRRGNYLLGQVLVSLGEPSGGEFTERAGRFVELSQGLDRVLRSDGRDEPAVQRVVELMEITGRIWEAWAWATTAAETCPNATWPRTTVARLAGLLDQNAPQTLDSANLAIRHDMSSFPDHRSLIAETDRSRAPNDPPPAGAGIRFEDTPDSGIDFVYANSADLATPGARMFEQTGGGVAVLDFDLDGRPDLYFAQGVDWKSGTTEPPVVPEKVDRVYRNVAGRRLIDVTLQTGLKNPGFGQGCAVGDLNNDGFPDLYVANVGRNRLYQNNGDGTFLDVTDDSGLTGDAWTASCALVDLNSDGSPDLYDVNYLSGADVYVTVCDRRACSPGVFEGAPDRLYVSRGDGSFDSVPNAAPEQYAKGLGVLAADVHDRGRPSLFIANDQVPNFFLRNEPSSGRFNIRLTDEAFISGLAFNADGLAMACMGIAADDADGNGLIDFFVTNFKDESNTLYLQDAPGLFVDSTRSAGLHAPSWPFVGWGTQFIDADLDGDPDLVLVNGNVDDYRDEGGEYHMRPQFFRNTGGGRFVELFADEIGEYFGRKYLGRALARLDWNGDGRMDFVVSNIGDRASLVTNESTDVGRFLNARLHATTTARDAIGTVVEVVTEDRRWTKQLVAGDGFMASNERVLQFGLGETEIVKEVHVNWPSGETTTFRDLPVDVTIQLIEGSPRVLQWPSPAGGASGRS